MQNVERALDGAACDTVTGLVLFDLARELEADARTPAHGARLVISDLAYAFAPSPLGSAGRARSLLGFMRMRRLRLARFVRPIVPATARYLDANGVVHEITITR